VGEPQLRTRRCCYSLLAILFPSKNFPHQKSPKQKPTAIFQSGILKPKAKAQSKIQRQKAQAKSNSQKPKAKALLSPSGVFYKQL
jgi:hypothetical protein